MDSKLGRRRLLFAAAAVLALPGWSEGPAVAAIAAGLLAVRVRASDPRIEWSAWIIAGASLVLLLVQLPSLAELEHALGETSDVRVGTALLRWAAVGVIAAAFAWKARWAPGRLIAQSVAVLLLYCAAAQLLPALALPLLPAIAILALAAWSRMLPPNVLLPALATLFVLILGWAFIPLGQWSIFALESLAGSPMLVVDLPAWRTTGTRLLIPHCWAARHCTSSSSSFSHSPTEPNSSHLDWLSGAYGRCCCLAAPRSPGSIFSVRPGCGRWPRAGARPDSSDG